MKSGHPYIWARYREPIIYWVLIIDIVNGVGNLFVLCSSFEFIIAQSPNQMRGIMIGLSPTVLGSGGLGNDMLATVLHYFPTTKNN